MYVAGNYSNGSDIRLKERGINVSNVLDKISDLSTFIIRDWILETM